MEPSTQMEPHIARIILTAVHVFRSFQTHVVRWQIVTCMAVRGRSLHTRTPRIAQATLLAANATLYILILAEINNFVVTTAVTGSSMLTVMLRTAQEPMLAANAFRRAPPVPSYCAHRKDVMAV